MHQTGPQSSVSRRVQLGLVQREPDLHFIQFCIASASNVLTHAGKHPRTGSENAPGLNLLYVISSRSREKVPARILINSFRFQNETPCNKTTYPKTGNDVIVLIIKSQKHRKQSGRTSAGTLPRWANPDVSWYSLRCCHKRLLADENFQNWQIKSDLAKTITFPELVFHLLLWDPAVLPDKMKF